MSSRAVGGVSQPLEPGPPAKAPASAPVGGQAPESASPAVSSQKGALSGSLSAASSKPLSDTERAQRVSLYQQQGIAAFNRSDPNQAMNYFQAARELDSSNLEILRWIERALEKKYKLESERLEQEYKTALRSNKGGGPASPISNFQPARVSQAPGAEKPPQETSSSEESPAESEEYTIRPEDVLQITVYEEPDLTTKARVSRNGEIAFPILGRVQVVGLSVSQLQEKLTQLLGTDYLVHPQVQVFIETSRSVFLTGEVSKPGSYTLSTERSTTVMEIITMAGGFTDQADLNGTRIIRTENGQRKTIRVRVADIIHKGDKSQDVQVRPDDIIFVPESFF